MNLRLAAVSVVLLVLLVAGVLLARGCAPAEPGVPVPPTATLTRAVPASPTPSPTSTPELPTSTAVPTAAPTGTAVPPSPTSTAVVPSPTPTVTLSPVPDPPYGTHRIEAGDTYWEQAGRWYGNPYCWPSLEEANGWSRFLLPIGAEMKLPAGCLKVVGR